MQSYKYLSAEDKRAENKKRYNACMGIVEPVRVVIAKTPKSLKPALKWNKNRSVGTCLPRAIRFPGSLNNELKKIRKAYKKHGAEAAYAVARSL